MSGRLFPFRTLGLVLALGWGHQTASFAGTPESVSRQDPVAQATRERVELGDRVLYGRQPIDYSGAAVDDVVARLVASKSEQLRQARADSHSGYLQAVLKALDVPVESQLLVFSKTARVQRPVSPQTPRAIYFTDDVMVAWTPTARELEITAIDPVKGAVFYAVRQPADPKPLADRDDPEPAGVRFERRDSCLACHASRATLEVPGLMVKSFVTDESGQPLNGFSRITHGSPYTRRFGGWYVTGSPAGLTHRGNLFGAGMLQQDREQPGFRSVLSGPVPVEHPDRYPAAGSDFVAHLIFCHYVHGMNLLIRAGMEARLNVRSDVEDHLIRYFVFADEPPLDAAVDGRRSPLAPVFQSAAVRDAAGRSLRSLDLRTRLLRYRLSWLVTHRAFVELPPACRSRLVRRLKTGLQTGAPSDDFGHLPEAERREILAIASATLPWWSDE